jgi:hypothetical protein
LLIGSSSTLSSHEHNPPSYTHEFQENLSEANEADAEAAERTHERRRISDAFHLGGTPTRFVAMLDFIHSFSQYEI